MRKNEFRVWDSRKNYFIDLNKSQIILNLYNGKLKGLYGGDGYVEEWELDEFTGLIDCNGKKVYTGDFDERGIVYFDEKFLGYFLKPFNGEDEMPLYDVSLIEVIGNIRKDKDLLEEHQKLAEEA